MPGIEIKGRSKIANYRHGGRIRKFGGGRTNLLEELGRVEAEPSNRNRRAEISRVHGELNRGYAKGGRAGFQDGKKVDITTEKFKKYYEGKPGIPKDPKKRKKYQEHWDKAEKNKQKRLAIEAMKPEEAGYAKGGVVRRAKKFKTHGKDVPTMAAKGGRIGLKKGGKPWGTGPKPGSHEFLMQNLHKRKGKAVGGRIGFREGKKAYDPSKVSKPKQQPQRGRHAEGGRIGLKKGGSDKKWIQKAVNPKHKGYCTPMTKKTCTPARKALARTFKKKAKTGW